MDIDEYNPFDLLPDEILLLIMSFLPHRQIYLSKRVCRRWNSLCQGDYIWRLVCFNRGLEREKELESKSFEWVYWSKVVLMFLIIFFSLPQTILKDRGVGSYVSTTNHRTLIYEGGIFLFSQYEICKNS